MKIKPWPRVLPGGLAPTLAALALMIACGPVQAASREPRNLAPDAQASTSFVSGHESLEAMHDGFEPKGIDDHSHGCYGNWPATGRQWVELAWDKPIHTNRVDVYWWDDSRGVRLPVVSRLLYWDGQQYRPVVNALGLGVAGGQFNITTFDNLSTTRLRLEFDGRGKFSTGIIEWKVLDGGNSPFFAPKVQAGSDCVVIETTKAYLCGETRAPDGRWSKVSGPGEVLFENAAAAQTTARFSKPGEYRLQLTATDHGLSTSDSLHVRVEPPMSRPHLEPLAPQRYSLESSLWKARIKSQIVHWIPYCVAKLSQPELAEGGFENIIQAANKLANKPYRPHQGPVWSDAYSLMTLEAMCLAQMVDAQGDVEMLQAQKQLRETIDRWVTVILAAQESDGYFQSAFTQESPADVKLSPRRWTDHGAHEGYITGNFLEAAVAHYAMTGGHDRRFYDGAKKLADCWLRHMGRPPYQSWFDGHQEIEQALVRFARLVNAVEGAHSGDQYVRLAKLLLDHRRDGDSYDQSHLPVVEQYQAVGHAVRAAYQYSAMAEIAMECGDAAYQSAVESIWQDLVHTKYYLTGGIGSGETPEGFGRAYSLPNSGYNESCAACGSLFFQHKLNLFSRQSRYADLMEETLYNAILGSVDLAGENYTYVNPLDQSEARYKWHVCPCCVGNIPRTLLMLPTWMYARSADELYVNLYIGSTVEVGSFGGAPVRIRQRTEYPWKSGVELEVFPKTPATFAISLRKPNRQVSALYRCEPQGREMGGLTLNGRPLSPQSAIESSDGYLRIHREWTAGDTLRWELPLEIQRVRADPRVVADRGLVALRYGPLIYNFESVDQNVNGQMLLPTEALTARWKPDLLGGIVALQGRFSNGQALQAIPNFARNNRGGRSIVWMQEAK